ncbi:hypothetical protein TNCV_1701851 [Trichonephila clavipes]|nr:hypothetical protein TNCV_1701851 [Trichonephila clavipes]
MFRKHLNEQVVQCKDAASGTVGLSVGSRLCEIAVVPDFHKRILFSDEAHFWLNGYVNKAKLEEANPQVYVDTVHPEKTTV